MPVRHAEAVWEGPFREGKGTMQFGGFSGPFNAGSRFEDAQGSNPEELIGAALAGCFSMAFSVGLGRAGFSPERIHTTAHVHIEKVGEGFTITRIELNNESRVPGSDQTQFQEIANATKSGCPVSRALAGTEIILNAKLSN